MTFEPSAKPVGGCRCGAVRYRLEVEQMPPIYCCHCLYCQTWSGSAFTEQAVVPESAIKTTHGAPVTFERVNDSGATSTQTVCGECHTRLWNVNSQRPGLAVVRAGTLDASQTLEPRAHIWTKRKQAWIAIDPAVPSWTETPPVAEFFAALTQEPR